jgi:hypothetical protein
VNASIMERDATRVRSRERIAFDAGYDTDRVLLHLYCVDGRAVAVCLAAFLQLYVLLMQLPLRLQEQQARLDGLYLAVDE